jgi:multiple sugar transport system ATP-binding protein
MANIAFEHASCQYAATEPPAVADLDLVIDDGELFVLCGPAGSGKSTVLRMLAGLAPVTGGRVLIDGDEVGARSDSPLVSMVFQNYSLYPNLTVDQNIALPLTQRGDTKGEIAAKVAKMADLLDLKGVLGQNASVLSAGQRIRVAMARGLVRQPVVLLMDEPLANLEVGIREELTDLIVTAQKRHGITSLYATSDLNEAVAVADRVALLDDGVLRAVGTPDQLASSTTNPESMP